MKQLLTLYLFFFTSVLFGQGALEPSLEVRLDSLSKQVSGLNEKVDFTLVDAPLTELLRAVAETHDLNVNIGDISPILITNNFTNVKVKDLIVFLCNEYGLDIKFTNNIFSFYMKKDPTIEKELVNFDAESGLITIMVQNEPLSKVAQEITLKTDYNILPNQRVSNQMTNGYLSRMSVEEAMINFAEVNNLKIEKRGDKTFQLTGTEIADLNSRNTSSRNQRLPSRGGGFELSSFSLGEQLYLSLSCQQQPVGDIIKRVAQELKIDYLLPKDLTGNLTCKIDSILFDDFLSVTLESIGQSYIKTVNNVYIIGESQQGANSISTIYSFSNRSLEGVEEIIPAALLKQVQIKPFNDLNALILTGTDRNLDRLTDFLKKIDVAVPNVLIEVIVVEVRKGYSISTGINAYLSDSVPTTSGQIFGGVDLTVSSKSLNNIMNNLDSRGIMNLGRVTPNFYATIQAMEQNNDLDIKSTPKLSTLNGHEASLTIGQSIYYLVETQNVTGGVNPIVTVTPRYEQVEANLSLIINPFVSDFEDVTLNIEAEFSDFIAPEIQGAPPGNATRKFISKIRVKNEEMVIIGGLEETSKSKAANGIPLLSRIPILKWIFSSRTEADSNSKLLIFIKPTIVY